MRSLLIDTDSLDEELIQQPECYRLTGRRHAQAVSVRDQAKDVVAKVRAEAYFRAKQQLQEDGQRDTEAAVAACIELDVDYQRAVKKYQRFRLAADELAADKEAWQQRAWMLKDLVALHIAGYYASSSVSAETSAPVREFEYAENRAKIARKRRRL